MERDGQQLTIYAGRHLGWWIDGTGRGGRRFMWIWWPTKGLARMVARLWTRLARRLGIAVTVAERDGRPREA